MLARIASAQPFTLWLASWIAGSAHDLPDILKEFHDLAANDDTSNNTQVA